VEEIKIADNIIDIPNGDIEVKESINVIENKEVLDRIKENYNTGTSDIKTVKRGEDDWYLYLASIKSNDILKNDVGIDDEMFDIFLLRHILEKLSFNENFEILNYIYFKDKLDELEIKIKKYYDDKLLVNKGVKGMILSKKNLKLNKNSQILLVLGSKSWNEGKQEDYTDLIPSIKKLIIPLSDYNLYVGFMGPFKDEEINIFKVKNMDDKRSKGARCDQSGKSDAVKLLNNIVGKDQDDNVKYTPSYIKGINKTEFCVLQEMYLRYFNETNKNNKRWFLSPEESIINDLEKIHLNK